MRISVRRHYAELIKLVELANLARLVPDKESPHPGILRDIAGAARPHRPGLPNITDFFTDVPESLSEPEGATHKPDGPGPAPPATIGTASGMLLLRGQKGSQKQVKIRSDDLLQFWAAVQTSFDGHPSAPVAIHAAGVTCLYNNPSVLLDDVRQLEISLRMIAERMRRLEPVLKAIEEHDRKVIAPEAARMSRSLVAEELMPRGKLKRDDFMEDKWELRLPASPRRRLAIQVDGTVKRAPADLCGDLLLAALTEEKNLRRLKICPICNTLYVALRYDEIACSKPHRKIENQRRFRKKYPSYDKKFRTKNPLTR